jgi:hypothetical protein
MIKPTIGPPSSPLSLPSVVGLIISVVVLGGGGGIVLEPGGTLPEPVGPGGTLPEPVGPGGILPEPVGPGGILLKPVWPGSTVSPPAPALEGASEDFVIGGGHTTDAINIATVNATKSFILLVILVFFFLLNFSEK